MDLAALSSPEAADATAVYAIGDIHGRLDLLQQMEALIREDIAWTRPVRPVICYLGDYIDRGPHSAQTIAHLSSLGDGGVARVFLKGNHEERMLAFLEDPAAYGPRWLQFGGREALESYGLAVPEVVADDGWDELRDALAARVPQPHLDFLRSLRLAFAWDRYLFVHAGLNPDREIEDQDPFDLMWIREPFLSAGRDWGRVVVHGHVIVDEPEFRANRIGIDTGAYKSGRLTCLVVSEGEPRLLTT